MSDNVQAYPLQWPLGRPRAESRQTSNFKTVQRRSHSVAEGVDFIDGELRKMGVDNASIVISTNLRLRLDGWPMSDQRSPNDPGVAVYFRHNERPVVFACDQWTKVEDNLWAVGLTLEALRGVDRWGAAKLEATFTGYAALPPGPGDEPWWQVLGLHDSATAEQIRDAHRAKVKVSHPDAGGDHDEFIRLQGAYERAMKARGA